MPDSRMRDRAEETARVRGREPDHGEVARALFAEHLDLEAIRRALGQRAAPGPGARAEARAGEARIGGGVDAAPPAPPLGRDLTRAARSVAPREETLAAPARSAKPMSRRVAVRAPALLGGIVAVAMLLEIGAPGIPGWPGAGEVEVPRPMVATETSPLPFDAASSTPTLALARPLAPVSGGDVVSQSPAPEIRARAAPEPMPGPDQPSARLASVPPTRVSVLVGDLGPGDMTRQADIAPMRFAVPTDQPAAAPSAPRPPSASRAGGPPVLARGAVEASAATPVGSRPATSRPASLTPGPTPPADPTPAAPWSSRAVVHLRQAPDGTFRARLTEALRRAGFDRVEWRSVADTVARTQTRFFHPGDARASERAAAVLAAQGRPASVRDFTHYDPPARAGTVEIWLSD